MKKLFILVFVFIFISSCSETINSNNKITVEQLLTDTAFQSFAEANKKLGLPILEKTSQMNLNQSSEFIRELETEINRINNLKISVDNSDLEKIVTMIGYEHVDHYKKLFIQAKNAFEKFTNKYPDFKQLDEKEEALFRNAMSTYYDSEIVKLTANKFKCDDAEGFNKCIEEAQEDFYWGTASCAVAGGFGGVLAFAGCQAIVVAKHEADKRDCAYDNC